MNMTNEFLQPRKEFVCVEDKEKLCKKLQLSLRPSVSTFAESMNSPSLDYSDTNLCRKRKHSTRVELESIGTQTSIELHLNDPLPVDWEQCLDLQSGRMYYLNRRTLKKSWERPQEQKLDLELNISTPPNLEAKATASSTTTTNAQYPKKYSNSSGSMVAVACLNCHLLVMISMSSPSCPNCKYVHSLPQPRKIEPTKTLKTLSLLH